MALIPIFYKADIASSKKGQVTPDIIGALSAFTLTNQSGILALGGQATNKGSISYNGNKATVTFNKGIISACGRLAIIEQDTTFDVTLPTITASGYIVVRTNLANSQEAECQIMQVTATMNVDLNENPANGIFDVILYPYTATSTALTLGTRTTQIIKKNQDVIENLSSIVASGNVNSAMYAQDSSGNPTTSKGSIEQRLTNLGFKSGSITARAGTATVNKITRQGNYVIGSFAMDLTKPVTVSTETIIWFAYTSADFKPLANYTCNCKVGCKMIAAGYGTEFTDSGEATVTYTSYSGDNIGSKTYFYVKVNKSPFVTGSTVVELITSISIDFGYEATPL